MLNEQRAWSAVYRAVEEIIALSEDVQSQIVSVTIAGSLVRGDFIEDNSDVDVYTLINREVANPWESEEHRAVKTFFDKYFGIYEGYSANPCVWDDVCIGEEELPKTLDDLAEQRIKSFGIYLFDLIENHRTVYGEDFTLKLPRCPDPRRLVIPRLDSLLERVEYIFENHPQNHYRIYMFAIEALKTLQFYFGEELTIDKRKVIEAYTARVPDFPMKSFGLGIWQDYVESKYPDGRRQHKPLEDYLDFLIQSERLVKENS